MLLPPLSRPGRKQKYTMNMRLIGQILKYKIFLVSILSVNIKVAEFLFVVFLLNFEMSQESYKLT